MRTIILLMIFILNYSIIVSQIDEKNNVENTTRKLKGTILINLSTGFKINSNNTTSATFGDVKTETDLIGIIGYQYWFAEQWAANASFGLFHADADPKYASVTSIDMNLFSFGISYYPKILSLGDIGRIHCGMNAGLYRITGTKSGVNVHNANICSTAIEEAVFGVAPNAGIDFFILNWIKIGPSVSYHILGDFDQVIGNRINYSGPVFLINAGLLL